MLILQGAYDGLAIGVIYALFSASFSLVLSTRGIWHFAHAGIYTIAGFTIVVATRHLGLPLWAGILIALIVAAGTGLAVELGGYRVFDRRKSGHFTYFIYALVLTTFIEGLLTLIFTTAIHSYGIVPNLSHINLFGIILTHWSLTAILCGGAILVIFVLFIERTRLGRTITAVSTNPDLAEIYGVNKERIYAVVMVLASLLVVPTVVLLGMNTGVFARMGFKILLIAVAGTIIGGIGSIRGAAFGGLLIGIVTNVATTAYIPSQWQDALAFFLMFLFILVRPAGLLGVKLRSVGG